MASCYVDVIAYKYNTKKANMVFPLNFFKEWLLQVSVDEFFLFWREIVGGGLPGWVGHVPPQFVEICFQFVVLEHVSTVGVWQVAQDALVHFLFLVSIESIPTRYPQVGHLYSHSVNEKSLLQTSQFSMQGKYIFFS